MLRNLQTPSCIRQPGFPRTCQLTAPPRTLSVVCYSDNVTSNGSTSTQPADATGKAAILARIAKAKQYKSKNDDPESGPGTGNQDAVQVQPATPTMPIPGAPRQVDWGAVASFIDSGGKSDDGSGSIQSLQNIQGGSQQDNEQLKEIAAQRAAR